MSNFIIPPEEFFASVGEPGGTYANSFEEWEGRAKAIQIAWRVEQDMKAAERSTGITVPQSSDITLQECPRCRCFHAGGCLEEREERLLKGNHHA